MGGFVRCSSDQMRPITKLQWRSGRPSGKLVQSFAAVDGSSSRAVRRGRGDPDTDYWPEVVGRWRLDGGGDQVKSLPRTRSEVIPRFTRHGWRRWCPRRRRGLKVEIASVAVTLRDYRRAVTWLAAVEVLTGGSAVAGPAERCVSPLIAELRPSRPPDELAEAGGDGERNRASCSST